MRRFAVNRETDLPLGAILLRMGVVSRASIVEALLAQPTASVSPTAFEKVSDEVAQSLPRQLAERHCCLAILHTDGHLVVAMADPFDQSAIAEITAASQLQVLPVAAASSDIRAAIAAKYVNSAA